MFSQTERGGDRRFGIWCYGNGNTEVYKDPYVEDVESRALGYGVCPLVTTGPSRLLSRGATTGT